MSAHDMGGVVQRSDSTGSAEGGWHKKSAAAEWEASQSRSSRYCSPGKSILADPRYSQRVDQLMYEGVTDQVLCYILTWTWGGGQCLSQKNSDKTGSLLRWLQWSSVNELCLGSRPGFIIMGSSCRRKQLIWFKNYPVRFSITIWQLWYVKLGVVDVDPHSRWPEKKTAKRRHSNTTCM